MYILFNCYRQSSRFNDAIVEGYLSLHSCDMMDVKSLGNCVFLFFCGISYIRVLVLSRADCGEDFRHSHSSCHSLQIYSLLNGESGKAVELKFTKSCVSASSIYPCLRKSAHIDDETEREKERRDCTSNIERSADFCKC